MTQTVRSTVRQLPPEVRDGIVLFGLLLAVIFMVREVIVRIRQAGNLPNYPDDDENVDTSMCLALSLGRHTLWKYTIWFWSADLTTVRYLVEQCERECLGPILRIVDDNFRKFGSVGMDDRATADLLAWNFRKWSKHHKSLPGVWGVGRRMSILLRLWAGCLAGAKTLSIGADTPRVSWVNTSEVRKRQFLWLARDSKRDRIFRLGARAALLFKLERGEEFGFEGIDSDWINNYVSFR